MDVVSDLHVYIDFLYIVLDTWFWPLNFQQPNIWVNLKWFYKSLNMTTFMAVLYKSLSDVRDTDAVCIHNSQLGTTVSKQGLMHPHPLSKKRFKKIQKIANSLWWWNKRVSQNGNIHMHYRWLK